MDLCGFFMVLVWIWWDLSIIVNLCWSLWFCFGSGRVLALLWFFMVWFGSGRMLMLNLCMFVVLDLVGFEHYCGSVWVLLWFWFGSGRVLALLWVFVIS